MLTAEEIASVPETITTIPAGNHPTQLGMYPCYAFASKLQQEAVALANGFNPQSYYSCDPATRTHGDYSKHYRSLADLDDWRQERPGQFVLRQTTDGHYSHNFLVDNPKGQPFVAYCSHIEKDFGNPCKH